MPRITPRTVRQAHVLDGLLPPLLPVCRDIRSAQLELRWLREHAVRMTKRPRDINRLLDRYVQRRARGEPLQYILGSEYFGELEIKCRAGVLIPRQETAASVSNLVDLISKGTGKPKHLRVLDLCTGTGCIPLLFHHDFFSGNRNHDCELELAGMDISPQALLLARENLVIQLQLEDKDNPTFRNSMESIRFIKADVLQKAAVTEGAAPTVTQALTLESGTDQRPTIDILISNPPYISFKDYLHTTSRSVRNFEPKLALVPESTLSANTSNDGDIFYPALLDNADEMEAKIVLFEVADLNQAKRVARLALQRKQWDGVEIWRDWPDDASDAEQTDILCGQSVRVQGSGHGRSVLLYRREGKAWLGR